MNEFTAIGSALASLKTAGDLTKAFLDVKTAVEVQGKVFELQRVILDAQTEVFSAREAQTALIEEKRRLEERIAELEAWDGEKERYQLQNVGPNNALAYALKNQAVGTEPMHHICANCYQHREKSHLQTHIIPDGRSKIMKCHSCGFELLLSGVADTRSVSKPSTGPRSDVYRRK
jgi:hypothetical protein